MPKSKSLRKNNSYTKTKTRSTKSPKKKSSNLLSSLMSKRWLPFAILFAIVGSVFTYMSFAASNTVTYSGQLSSSQPSQTYTVTAGDTGVLTAAHNAKDASIRVAILDGAGTVLAEKAGSRASVSTTVAPGTYSIKVDYTKQIKGVKKYNVTITYPIMETAPPPVTDTTPPTALISSPTTETVSGTVAFSATASDNVAVTKVEFLVDSTVVSSDTSSPYTYSWNTTTVPDGSHNLQIKAYDAAGNVGTASRPITVANTVTPPPPTTYPAALYHGDADIDRDSGDKTLFLGKNTESNPTSRLSIVDDPKGQYGKVYKSELLSTDISSGNKRAEWTYSYLGDGSTKLNLWGTSAPSTTDLYIGWRSLFGGNVTLNNADNGGNYLQWKGDATCGGPAVGGTIAYNRFTIRTLDGDHLAYTGPLMSSLLDNRWHDMVMRVNFSKTNTGFIEFWLDGAKQTMANGQERIYLPTVCPNDTKVWAKYGVYGMDSGAPIHWLESPRIGTSYESVVPR